MNSKFYLFIFFLGNLNPFNGYNTVGLNYIKNIKSSAALDGKKFSEKLSTVKASIFANRSLGPSFMQNISFSLTDMLLSCYYDGDECNSSSFIQFTSYDRGNCYSFNLNTSNIQTSAQSGPFYGLQLELFGGFDGKIYSILNFIQLLFRSYLSIFFA